MNAIKSFTSDGLKERFEKIGKFKPLILRIRICNDNFVHIEDFDIITLQNIRRVSGYQPSKEFAQVDRGQEK